MTKELVQPALYAKIAELLQTARQAVVRAVNQAMVYTYYEIGRMIVEDEQEGKERAAYGKQALKELSKRLTDDFGKGFSERNLEQMRQFYLTYSISQKSSAELQRPYFQPFRSYLLSANTLLYACHSEPQGVESEAEGRAIKKQKLRAIPSDSSPTVLNDKRLLAIMYSLLCKDKNDTLVEITLPEDNDSIFASRYQTVLPDKQLLIELLNEGGI